ncbi:MAG TPA: radical SAM protein [Dehalococcoidia bacterium]|nr:radical SAM protein [Dehalococcoidia bacterium]
MTWKAVKEARQRLEREKGTIYKDWGGRTPVALIYPNSYYLGMSNLGFQTVYGFLNSYENVACERVFWQQNGRRLEEPISLESQRPLGDFDVLAFSISYELDYFNAVHILKASGIPHLAADRDESHPLIIAGGPCVAANPQPLSMFFDCFAIGEGEVILPNFVEVLARGREVEKDALLKEMSSIPGIYVPILYNGNPVRRQWLADLDSVTTTSVILTPDTDLSDMYLIEIARGCGWGCRFCLAGYIFRPFRYRSLKRLLAQAKRGLEFSKRTGLLAAAVSDHPEIDELVHRLRQMGADISVSSLRMHPLSDAVLQGLAESGSQTISFAPEAGSERLRQIINKCLTERDIVEAVEKAAKQGLKQIKLYFMIGLPMESDDDIEEMIRLTLNMKSRIERTGCRIALTVEPFVPKAGTPFQWLAMAREEVLNHRLKEIKSKLTKSGIEVRTESIGWSLVQGVLSRGDARLGAALANMQGSSLSAWHRALEEYDLSADDYLLRELPPNKPLPWSIVNSGITSEYLREELEKARQGSESPPCPPRDCHKCGVC